MKNAAREIYNKISNCNVDGQVFAVVVMNGAVSAIKTNTNKFQLLFAAQPEKIVGIYDIFCTQEMIAEDLAMVAGHV